MAISTEDLVRTNAVMFALASLFVLSIAWLHISKRKPCELSEIVLYFGYIIYVVFWSCYMAAIPLISKMLLVATGEMLPYQGFFADIKVQIALIAAGQVFYLTVLFLVKLSFLMLYRKLVVGLPGLLMYIWWGIVGLVVVVSDLNTIDGEECMTNSITVLDRIRLCRALHLWVKPDMKQQVGCTLTM